MAYPNLWVVIDNPFARGLRLMKWHPNLSGDGLALFQQDLERCMPHWPYKRVMELALQDRVHQVPPDLWQWATDLTPPVPLSPGRRETPIEVQDGPRPFAQPSVPGSASVPLTGPDAVEQEVEAEPEQGEGEWGEEEHGNEWERRCYLLG